MSALPDPISAHVELLFSDMNGVPRGKVIDGATLKPGYRPHMGLSVFFRLSPASMQIFLIDSTRKTKTCC